MDERRKSRSTGRTRNTGTARNAGNHNNRRSAGTVREPQRRTRTQTALGEEQYDEAYLRARRERIRRLKLEKKRQAQRRRIMRLAAMAAVLVIVIILAAFGISKLTGGKGNGENHKAAQEVKAETTEEISAAQSQPVMSASDLSKFTGEVTLTGWQKDSEGKWYRNSDGTFYENGWQEIDGSQYYFDENGYVKTGWQEIDGEDCWFDEEGRYDSTKVRPMVALTFDDGPGQYTEQLLDCLEQNNAKATFFMLGQNVKEFPDTVKRMKELGMELANHTYDHQLFSTLSEEKIIDEIESTNKAIEAAAGASATALRPPGGDFNDTVRSVAGMPIVIWSIDTKDWQHRNADTSYQVVMENAQDGSIVLMHDIHEPSVQAALRIIPDLIEKGFKLVTVSELAEAKGQPLEDGKVYYYLGEGQQQVE